MNKVFIIKLKNALQTTHPIDAVKEVVAEYEEIDRLAQWKKRVILSGQDLKKHQQELDKVGEILEQYGCFTDFYDCDLDKKVREYFKDL